MDTIGIDVGSTNVKAVLVDAAGITLARTSRAMGWEPVGEVAELDAEELWQAVLGALSVLGAEAPAGLGGVGAVGVCGQYSSIVPVDRHNRPVSPMRLYLDQRGTRHCQAIYARHPDALATWMERHPVPPLGGGLALGHLLAFQIDHPDVHEATATYLEPVDYVTARLTGRATATQGSMFASQLVDNRTLGRLDYDPELVAMAQVDPSRLPPLVAADEVVGDVSTTVATGAGLPPGVAVLAGMTDTHAAALATGAAEPGRVGVAIGTTAVVLDTTDRLHADFDHEVLAMAGVRPDEYLVWAENGLAGRAVEHVLDRFVHADDALGEHGVTDPFGGFEGALSSSPVGSGGVRFLPWLSGSMAPQADGAMRGAFVGISLHTERVDLVRATVEGVAHNLRWLLGPVEAFSGHRAEEVVLVGGAARSPAWSQVLADVLARPVRTVTEPGHACARAMATWAAHLAPGLGPGGAAGGGPPGAGQAGTESVGGSSLGRRTEVARDRTASTVGPVDGPGLGSRWGERYDPDPSAVPVHDATHVQFTAAFDALRPLRLGSRRQAPD